MGNALLRKARIGTWTRGCEKQHKAVQLQHAQWHKSMPYPQKSHILPYEPAEVRSRRGKHSPFSCAVVQFLPWSRDPGTRCDWLLDLHAAFKSKSRANTQLALQLGNRRRRSQFSLLPPSFPCIQGICIWDNYLLPVSRLKSLKFWNCGFKAIEYYVSSKTFRK